MLKNTAAVIKHLNHHMGMGQNLVPLVNIKIAGKWMFISLNMVLIGIDPYPHLNHLAKRGSSPRGFLTRNIMFQTR